MVAIQCEQCILPLKYLEISHTDCFAGRRQERVSHSRRVMMSFSAVAVGNLSCACSVISLSTFCGEITDQNGLVCLVKPCQTLVRLSELFLQEHCGSSFIFRKKFRSIHKDIFSIVQRIL